MIADAGIGPYLQATLHGFALANRNKKEQMAEKAKELCKDLRFSKELKEALAEAYVLLTDSYMNVLSGEKEGQGAVTVTLAPTYGAGTSVQIPVGSPAVLEQALAESIAQYYNVSELEYRHKQGITSIQPSCAILIQQAAPYEKKSSVCSSINKGKAILVNVLAQEGIAASYVIDTNKRSVAASAALPGVQEQQVLSRAELQRLMLYTSEIEQLLHFPVQVSFGFTNEKLLIYDVHALEHEPDTSLLHTLQPKEKQLPLSMPQLLGSFSFLETEPIVTKIPETSDWVPEAPAALAALDRIAISVQNTPESEAHEFERVVLHELEQPDSKTNIFGFVMEAFV